jgi:GNAT superfamily N-acetyltransferase
VTDTGRSALAAIRPATLDDVPDIRSILAEHGNDGPHSAVDIVGPYVRHLVQTARALVSVESGRIVAFGAAAMTGHGRHLTDLFVRTDRLGHGIGRPLLDAVFADDWPRTTFASDDPRAMPLYIRAGMAPLWPSLYLVGSGTNVPGADSGLTAHPAEAARQAELELAWTSIDRSIDHAFWASQADSDPFVILDGRDVIAAGYARARQIGPVRALDRLLIRPGQPSLGPVCLALRRAARGGQVRTCLPGPNGAVRPLLEAGFRIEDRDMYMASRPDLVDPDRLVPNPGML